jgi:hypothetical protein
MAQQQVQRLRQELELTKKQMAAVTRAVTAA